MRILKRITLLLCLIFLLAPVEVPAEDSLEISITYGIDGKVQLGKGFPATVTVKNNGETISGDLVFFTSPNYETVGNIVVPVEFPKDEETTLTVSIPGLNDYYVYGNQNNNQQLVKFYEDGWENGKEVPLKGNTTKSPTFFQENRVVIGVLTETPDELNVLKTVRYNSDSIELLNLTKDNFPSDVAALEIFDVILINNYQVANLTDQQAQAVLDWVKAGGHIMLGSDPLLGQHEVFKELFLMEIDSQTSFEELNFFSTVDNEELPNFNNVEINTGNLKENVNILYSDHSLPMIMNKSVGLGEVTQFAFNVSSETLTKWEEYDSFWSDLLQKAVDKDYNGTYMMMNEIPYRISSIVELYPSSFIPVTALVTLFIVYLILLIPGLYFLLKRLDKREISWIIIPAVAIISSIAIFVVGAKDRIGGSQINNISVLSIDEDGIANGYGALSILSNNAGDYPVTIKSSGFQPYPLQNYHYNPDESVESLAMIEKGRQQSKITFTDVEYWSIRSAMGTINSVETGNLQSDLWIEDTKLKGTIKSELAFDIEEAYLLSGSNSYPLGEIIAGETSEIELELDTKNIQNLIGAPRSSIASKVIPGHGYSGSGISEPQDKDSMEDWKKYELLDLSMDYEVLPKNLNKPLIVGYVTEPIIGIESDKKVKSIHSLSVITQMVDVELRSLQSGEFKFSNNMIIPELSILSASTGSGNIYHNGLAYGESSVDVEQGSYLLTYQIPLPLDLNSMDVNKLRLRHPVTNDTTFSIYHVENDEYIVLEGGQTTFEENPEQFISNEGKVLVKFEKSGTNDPVVRIPTLDLEGEYNQ